MPKYNPNSELVIQELLRAWEIRPSASFGVGAVLPDKSSSWLDGFVQVQVVGGSSDINTGLRQPLIQIDCYVYSNVSNKVLWPKANTIAEDIFQRLLNFPNTGEVVSLAKYNTLDANVYSIYPATEIRRVNGDPSGYARYTFDLSMNWAARADAI